jgi:hypothetical protein
MFRLFFCIIILQIIIILAFQYLSSLVSFIQLLFLLL